jgi:hypothetical protein
MPVVAFTLPCGSTSSVRSSGVAAASGAALCATASNRDGGLEAEILVLRHQLNLLSWADRALFVWLYRGFPGSGLLLIVAKPGELFYTDAID